MVKVIDFKERVTNEGRTFYVLVVEGGVEVVNSRSTGKPYFRKKMATVPTSFEADTCDELIGSEFNGSIEKRPCEPYDVEIEETGEIIEVSTRNVFIPKEEPHLDLVVDEKSVM